MPCRAFALLRHRVGPSMSSALRCSWLASARAHHTHPLCSLSRAAAPHIRQRSVWRQQRHSTTTAGADNGNSASADEQTFFATTPLYYVRTARDSSLRIQSQFNCILGGLIVSGHAQVNAEPHMGSAYTTMAADAIARFQRLQGKKVTLVTGQLLNHTCITKWTPMLPHLSQNLRVV